MEIDSNSHDWQLDNGDPVSHMTQQRACFFKVSLKVPSFEQRKLWLETQLGVFAATVTSFLLLRCRRLHLNFLALWWDQCQGFCLLWGGVGYFLFFLTIFPEDLQSINPLHHLCLWVCAFGTEPVRGESTSVRMSSCFGPRPPCSSTNLVEHVISPILFLNQSSGILRPESLRNVFSHRVRRFILLDTVWWRETPVGSANTCKIRHGEGLCYLGLVAKNIANRHIRHQWDILFCGDEHRCFWLIWANQNN